jgi:hypothetical protein
MVSHSENGIQHPVKIEIGLTTTNGTEYRTSGLRNPHNCLDTEIARFVSPCILKCSLRCTIIQNDEL